MKIYIRIFPTAITCSNSCMHNFYCRVPCIGGALVTLASVLPFRDGDGVVHVEEMYAAMEKLQAEKKEHFPVNHLEFLRVCQLS